MNSTPAQGVKWNLSDLYRSVDDTALVSDLELAKSKSVAFEAKYKLLLQNISTSFPLFELVEDYKEIATLLTRLGTFSHLSFAEKTNDPARGAFMQKIQVGLTDIQSHLLFFEVCWNKLPENTAQDLMKDPRLKNDLHFLNKMRLYAPHTLAEGEEKIMAIKSNTAGSAFSRLFDETMNQIPFYVEVNGQKVKKTEGEVLTLFHSTDRNQRKMASDSLAEGLEKNTHLLTYIYNMILADHRSSLKIRGFKHPADAMNLSNEIDLESVLNLVTSVKKAYPLAARYYRLTKKLLGLDKLYDHDRYAHVGTD